MEWQPIEAAPKDGIPVLVWAEAPGFSDITGIDLVWWERTQWLHGNAEPYPGIPSHWMPLPKPPSIDNPSEQKVEAEEAQMFADHAEENGL